MENSAQKRFETLRQAHYPAELNRIAAHLTLFHSLPGTAETRAVLLREAAAMPAFPMRVSGIRSLGRGVAFTLESPELAALHRRLAKAFESELSAQDRQGFRPHVVVQNKVSGAEAKELLALLGAGFSSFTVQAEGLEWWDYLGGPWKLRETFGFRAG